MNNPILNKNLKLSDGNTYSRNPRNILILSWCEEGASVVKSVSEDGTLEHDWYGAKEDSEGYIVCEKCGCRDFSIARCGDGFTEDGGRHWSHDYICSECGNHIEEIGISRSKVKENNG